MNQVSIQVEEAEIVGLIGPNGSGKTTFLNAIAGFDPPANGSIYSLGRETAGFHPETSAIWDWWVHLGEGENRHGGQKRGSCEE